MLGPTLDHLGRTPPPSEKVAAPSEYNKKRTDQLGNSSFISCSFDAAENMKYTLLLSIWQNDIFSPHKRKGANGVTFTNDTREQLLNNSILQRKSAKHKTRLRMCKNRRLPLRQLYSYIVPRKWKQMFSLGLPLFMSFMLNS